MSLLSATPILPNLSRRAAMLGIGATAALGTPALSFAATGASGPRLVVINVRGGLDGLATVIPIGDTYLQGLRGKLVPGTYNAVDGFFALHPSLPNLYTMFKTKEALAVHCVGPIVDTRSHFLGQDFLQGGSTTLRSDGWLNRMLSLINYSGALQPGLAVDPTAPLVIRGNVPIAGWSNDPYPYTNQNLNTSIEGDASADTAIYNAYAIALSDRNVFNQILNGNLGNSASPLVRLAQVAGLCLASPYGPSAAVIQTGSYDTHYNQNATLPALLTDLDNAFAALKVALGSAWGSTVVLTMTEFGRRAAANGTGGSDHGTAFAMFLAGGAVAGGRVVVNNGWPGLNNLFQNLDLQPTADFRQVVLGILEDHMGISSANRDIVFPGSDSIGPPITGLVNG